METSDIRNPKSEIRNARSQIQLVIFDLGGVLVRIHYSWAEACAAHGIPQPHAIDDEWSSRQLREAGIRYETGASSYEAFLATAMAITNLSNAEVRKVFEHWLIEPYPDVHAFVEDVASADVATACLSNTNARHWELMHDDSHATLPLKRLNHRFASHLVGVMKPDAGIYEHLETKTGVPSASLLFFDDNAANIAAARKRGWNAEQIDPRGETVEQMRGHLQAYGVM